MKTLLEDEQEEDPLRWGSRCSAGAQQSATCTHDNALVFARVPWRKLRLSIPSFREILWALLQARRSLWWGPRGLESPLSGWRDG